MHDRYDAIRDGLEAHGQAHVLRHVADLSSEQQAALFDQVESIDLAWLQREASGGATSFALPDDLEPAPYYPVAGTAEDLRTQREAGETLVHEGRVAVLTVAGGQGTRLGWSGPKGTYPATVVTGKPLFRGLAEQIIANERRHGVTIPWYIMTSPANDASTRAFFQDNNWFGLQRGNVFLFPQNMVPSVDAETGRLLLSAAGEIAMNPDGHGGSIKALAASGALEDMRNRGIELISYGQVDNPLLSAVDPQFIGLHATAPDSSGEMSSKMVLKTDPGEKVGVFGRTGGRTVVVEYSDLPEELAELREASGALRFRAGSIAVHLLGVDFVDELTRGGFALPYHRALKKVPYLDERGARVEPETPNAIKLETFVFDALPLARASIVYETLREDEFAPIKNATGVDSPRTSHQLQSDRAGRWLEAHGVEVARDDEGHVASRIEISPLTALEPADLVAIDLPDRIGPGDEVVL